MFSLAQSWTELGTAPAPACFYSELESFEISDKRPRNVRSHIREDVLFNCFRKNKSTFSSLIIIKSSLWHQNKRTPTSSLILGYFSINIETELVRNMLGNVQNMNMINNYKLVVNLEYKMYLKFSSNSLSIYMENQTLK